MTDSLVGFTQAMNLLPDNTSRLIGADDVRSSLLSLMPDRGTAFADPAAMPKSVTIPAVNTWVDLPVALGGAPTMQSGAQLFWRMDANGHLKYDYPADWPTITVPPGTQRISTLYGVIDIDPNGVTWEFAFTVAGVPRTLVYRVIEPSQTDALSVAMIDGPAIDVSVAPLVSVSVRNLTNATPLLVRAFSFRAIGGPLA
jgi:hypothetical protein